MIEEKEIRALAKLAKLKLSDEEVLGLSKDMVEIVAFADKINANLACINTAPEERIVQYADLREDEVIESLPQEEILATVFGGERGCYAVKKRGGR